MIRALITSGFILLLFFWERHYARRPHQASNVRHQILNLSLGAINFVVVRVMTIFLGSAVLFQSVPSEWQWSDLFWIPFLDLIIYFQHRLFHAIPFLWRFHWVHHTDQNLNWTSGVRFHLGEILLSLILKWGVVFIFQIPLPIYLIYEGILASFSLFNHANIQLPKRLESALRAVIVTPDFHRIHHSIEPKEMNSNFGNGLIFWDRVFRTYRRNPRRSHSKMILGLKDQQKSLGFFEILLAPLKNRHFKSN